MYWELKIKSWYRSVTYNDIMENMAIINATVGMYDKKYSTKHIQNVLKMDATSTRSSYNVSLWRPML